MHKKSSLNYFLENKIGEKAYPFVSRFLPNDRDKRKIYISFITALLQIIGFGFYFFTFYFDINNHQPKGTYMLNSLGLSFLFLFLLLLIFLSIGTELYIKNDLQKDEIQETENLENYEDLRSKYTLHNVKNATTSLDRIVGSLEVNKLSQENIDDLKNYLERIYLTLDDFENNESSRLRKQESFAIKELVNLFDKLVKAALKAQRIKFQFVNQIDEDKIIYQNLWDVFQVLHNLVLNAQNALELPKIKEITLLCQEIDSSTVRFFVKDTGIGIPTEHKNKVFKVGFSTTGSSGLGLPYIKDTVEKMKGKVTLQNADENFSTIFEAIIPSEKI